MNNLLSPPSADITCESPPFKVYLSKGKKPYIPVPEFFWKAVYDPSTDGPVVFVGLNNPHFEGDPRIEASICPDQCASARYVEGITKQGIPGKVVLGTASI